VTPQWLVDSVKHGRLMPYGDYAALNELNNLENCGEKEDPVPGLSKLPTQSTRSITADTGNITKLSHTARFSCARASPLVCLNQELVAQLDIVRRSRDLEGEDISALSYARAAAVSDKFISTPQELIWDIRS